MRGEPMKKLIALLLVVVSTVLFSFSSPAWAEDGAKIFSSNCAQCHAGGKNLVNPAKTLKKEDLEKYNKYSKDAIVTQVTNGAGAMPNFKRLGEDKIKAVAAYVLEQAENGWK